MKHKCVTRTYHIPIFLWQKKINWQIEQRIQVLCVTPKKVKKTRRLSMAGLAGAKIRAEYAKRHPNYACS